jgi:RHS repeat-associated protein
VGDRQVQVRLVRLAAYACNRASSRYILLLSLLAASLWSITASAQTNHPGCFWMQSGYQCPTPQTPATPFVNPNPSVNGNVTVTVTNGDPYSWIELNIGGPSSRGCFCTNPTFSRTLSPGQWSITARRCLTPDGSSIRCSSYSSAVNVTVLGTPGAPSVSAISGGACSTSLSVSWSSGSGYPAGATTYYDVQELSAGSWTQPLTDTTSTSRSRSVVEGDTYQHAVRSRYSLNGVYSQYSAWTYNSTLTIPQCAPSAPGNPSLSHLNPSTGTNVNISWSPVAESILGYRVQRYHASTGWQLLGACTTSGTSCTDTDAHTRGETYQYRVQAYKSAVDGPWGAASSVTISYATPTAPSTPAFSGVAPYGYTVSWNNVGDGNTGTISYILWERVGGGSWTNVGSGGITSQSFSNRSAATTYEYMVRACNPNSVCVDSTVNAISFPGTPGAISISGIGDFGRSYTLNWGAAGGSVSGYELQRSTDGGANWSGVSNLDGAPLSEAFSNASVGTTYQYRVRAVNSQAYGVYSAVRQYWVPAVPSLTANLNAPALSLTLSWPALPATHYQLDQSVNGGAWQSIATSYTQTSYTATVINGYSYSYRVRSCNADGACSQNAESLNNGVPPAAPGTINASQPTPADSVNVAVNWAAVSGQADGYYLERQNLTTGSGYAQIAATTSTSYTDTGVVSNNQYQYRVRAWRGTVTGAYSPASSALRIRYTRPVINMSVGGASQQGGDVYSAGYNGIYSVNWSAGGFATSFTVNEQERGGAWQAASTNGQCAANQCNYDKPFNDSGADHVYRYRGQACNVDFCSVEREITVNVNTYPTPGPPTNFSYQYTGTPSDGGYTLSWTAPINSPPNVTGPSAEAVTHYELIKVSPADAGPWQHTHSNTQTAAYTRAFSGGVSGQTYTYAVRACFLPGEPGAITVCSGNAGNLAVRIPYAPPNQPGGLNHTNLNAQGGSYTLQWTAASGQVSYYEIQRLIDGQWVYFATSSPANHPVAGHANGESRSYRVRACNADSCGAYTAAHEVYVPHLAPGVPSGLSQQSLDAAGRTLTLVWSAPVGAGQVQNYEVEQSINGGTSWQAASGSAGTTLAVTGLVNGTNYRFRVRACNVDACGGYSAQLTQYLPYTAPGVPGAISHDPAENNPASGAFIARWTAPSPINAALAPLTYYQVEYSANGGTLWQTAPTGGPTPGRINVSAPAAGAPASATLSGLTTGAPYSVRVRACNADACGDNAAPYQVYLSRPAPGAPTWLPTVPSAQDYEARRFTVQWTAPVGVAVHHYQLEAYGGVNNGFASWVIVAATPATAYTFIDRAYGQAYRYRVRACSESQSGAANCSAWVESAEVRLRYPAPNAPGGIAVSGQSGGTFTLSWNGVLGWAPQYTYELQESRNNAAWTTPATQTITSYTRTGRSAATYRYRVRACNPAPDSDCSGWSPETTVTVLPTPVAPASITVNTGDAQTCRFNVSWVPGTGGTGTYHYELAVQTNTGGAWTSIAWTTGTAHNMIVNHANVGLPHSFRVRARTLSNGQYSAWSSWRTSGAATTACSTTYNSTTDQLYISAPRYSATGQYTVNMQSTRGWAPGFEYRYDVRTNGVWSSVGAAVPPAMLTLTYGSGNPRPTGRYQYRVSTCDHDIYPNDDPITCPGTVDAIWDTLAIDTTVLRNPGNVTPVQIAGLPNPIEGVYLIPSGQFTLDWAVPTNAPGPATQTYEVQYRPTGSSNWMPWAEQGTADMLVTLPDFGVSYDFRVRACARLDEYVNCGNWAQPAYPVRRSIGAPRLADNTYPADGELVIYSSRVPLQWLPPLNMAASGVDHYEISLRSRQLDDDGEEFWVGPVVLSTPAAVAGSESNPPVQQDAVDVEDGGQKEFLIRACGSTSPTSCGAALTFQITVVLPPDPPQEPAGMAGQAHPDPSIGAQFNGALAGSFSVQASGAGTYNLPIVVPPGTAGMQPKLSLGYSSQAGNGIAGMGWSIGGLSVISRCNKTRDQDGEVRAVDYSDNDAYCLDGQRLVHIGGVQYRTEINDFRRITKMSGGICGTWFEVKSQAGVTLQYGNSADSCVNAQRHNRYNTAENVIQGWALNRTSDISGNYIAYKYEEQTALGANSFVIDRIEYTGRNSGTPYTAVDFRYETGRPDPVSGYQGGVGSLQTRRLTRITTGVNPADTSDDPAGYGVYTLNYQADSDLISRLTSIEYCATDASDGSADTQCMEPLEFEWSAFQPGWERLANYTPPLPFSEGYPGKDLGARLADLNNDGLPDLLYARPGTRTAYLNTGSGWQVWSAYQSPVDFVNANGEDLGVQLADLNGDLKPELLTSVNNGSNLYRVYENTGSGWSLNASMSLPEPVSAYTLQVKTGVRLSQPSTDSGLRLADLNGDGLIDLIQGSPNNTRRAWRNTGNSSNRWELWAQYAPPVRLAARRRDTTTWPVNPPMGFEDPAYDATGWLDDFNNDGLTDLMYKVVPQVRQFQNTEVIDYRVILNTGSGWGPDQSAHATMFPLDVEDHGPDAGIRLVDLNGDGLPDMMRGNHSHDMIAYNTGTGWLQSTPFEATPEFQSTLDNITVKPHNRLLLDVNHDGRTDVLFSGSSWLSSEEPGDGWKEFEYGAPFHIVDYPAAVRIADINGDGRIDLLNSIAASNQNGTWSQRGGRRYITGVADSLGNTTGIKYKALIDRNLDGRSRPIYTRTTNTLNPPYEQEVNAPIEVVDRVSVDDGIGGELTTEYAYRGLTSTIGGRGLQGFESMTAYRTDGTVVTTRNGTRFPYIGLPLEVKVTYGEGANAPLLESTVHEYCYAVTSASTMGNAANPETLGFTSASGTCGAYDDRARNNEAIFVFARRSTAAQGYLSDNLQSTADTITTVTDNTYGVYGYLSNSLATTSGDGHIYTTQTSHIYDSSQPDWRWQGRVQETTSIRRVDGADDGNNTRKLRYEYYPANGLLRKEIVEPDAQAPLKVVTAYAYDQFGNSIQTTVCASDFSYCEAGAQNPNAASSGSEAFRTITTAYDNRGRYVVSLTNALNQTEIPAHNHPLGLRTGLTGANGLSSSWSYDSLGRKVAETTVFGVTTYEYRKANGGYVPGARYTVQENPPGAAPLRLYYDGKGRERRKLTQNLHGEWVAADILYDHFGRVERSSEPYFVYGTLAGDAHWTETDYDALGRVTEVRVPLGDINADGMDDGVATTSSDYQGFDTIATDTRGRRKLKALNALGQTVRAVDDLDGAGIPVDYTYDSQGNLETTTVDNNPATTVTIQHNNRGHKTGMTDPDMGHWDYRSNGFGELVWQRDAKGQIVESKYDALGRTTQRREWPDENNDGVVESVQTSTWTYDTAPGAGVGKPHTENGSQGDTKVYSYTARGQLAETAYGINTNGWSQSFTVSQTYDVFGRVQLVSYPQVGSERLTVENRYSPFGGLWYVLDAGSPVAIGDESVYWIAEMADARGNVIQETLRNQNIINATTNTATGWLQKVESWDKDLNMIQQSRYAFDEVGNIQSRERFRPWVVNPDGSFRAGGNEQVAEAFAYDSLDRLTGATVMRDGSVESSKDHNYDRLGNFTYKDSTGNPYSYTGCNGGPHAVCSVGGTSFSYDANGNMVESTGAKARTIQYSAFNKPSEITEGGAVAYFAYGADRARMFKQSLSEDGRVEVTWYVGLGAEGKPLYEQTAVIEGGQIVSRQHLNFLYAGAYHGGEPFAVRVVDEAEDNNPSLPNFVRYGGTEYYHRDHLGSVIAITGDTGAVEDTRLMSFDAWGKRRNADWSEGGGEPVDQYTREGMRGNLAYTGHEAVPEVGLIHMNGRVYDPELGVFLSADPHVQFAEDSQSYNRYSYVRNNPIRYTDPSGYFIDKLLRQIPSGLATIISIALNFVPYCWGWCSALFNMQYAHANGATFGEALLGGAIGFFGAGFGQIAGAAFGGSAAFLVEGAVAGAFVGGVNAAISGGNFFRGALRGALYGAAMAIVTGAISEAIASLQPQVVESDSDIAEVNGKGFKLKNKKEVDQFYQRLAHMAKRGPNGEAMIEGTVSISGNGDTPEQRAALLKANGTYSTKPRWRNRKTVPELKLIVNLSEHNGAGKGDLHILTRDEISKISGKYNRDFDDISYCSDACTHFATASMHLGSTSLGQIQAVHEIFHALGFRHRSGGLMYSTATRIYSEDVQMLLDSPYYTKPAP